MKIIALDTATEVCSVALSVNGQVFERVESDTTQASRIVLQLLQEVLKEADLSMAEVDLLAFGQGPGSFTGVRVATALVQGLALGNELQVMPVSNLAATAYEASMQGAKQRPVLAVLDARMAEVYCGGYQMDSNGQLNSLLPDALSAPVDLTLPMSADWVAAGNADSAYSEVLKHLSDADGNPIEIDWIHGVVPRASGIAELARRQHENGLRTFSAEAVEPVYLRNQVTQSRATR